MIEKIQSDNEPEDFDQEEPIEWQDSQEDIRQESEALYEQWLLDNGLN